MATAFDYDVFLSYSARERKRVRALAERLEADGLRVWRDEWPDRAGRAPDDETLQALDRSRVLVACLSPGWLAAAWPPLAPRTLPFRDPADLVRRFVPLLVANCDAPAEIAQFSTVDGRAPGDEAYASLLAACREGEEPVGREGEVVRTSRVLGGHTGWVRGVAITPDGETVVSGSQDSTLKVWDLASGHCRATLEGHTRIVEDVAITPDRKRIISASWDGTLRVWELPPPATAVEVAGPRYTNAKVVLVGESGAGKTGLALRLAEGRWEETGSTHGMRVWQLNLTEPGRAPPQAHAVNTILILLPPSPRAGRGERGVGFAPRTPPA